MLENDAPKKTPKNLPPKSLQKDGLGVQMGWVFRGGNVPRIIEIHNFEKINPRDVQGSKRRSKLHKFDPTGIKFLKSQCKELQRTLHPIRAFQVHKIIQPLECPRSMQVYRYSSRKPTEQPKCKELQRTLHPIRPYQTQNNFEVRRCRVSVLN